MKLGDAIKKATASVVPDLISNQLANSTVDTTRMIQTRDAAKRTINTPINSLVGARWYIREVSVAHAQRIWSISSAAVAEAQVPLGTDVASNDVVRIIEGDFAGNVYEIGQLKHDTFGSRILIELVPTGQQPYQPGD